MLSGDREAVSFIKLDAVRKQTVLIAGEVRYDSSIKLRISLKSPSTLLENSYKAPTSYVLREADSILGNGKLSNIFEESSLTF